MMDPGMSAAPLPEMPVDPMAGGMDPLAGAPMGPPSPVDAVIAALMGMQMQRQGEDDAVLAAVMKATGAGMPLGFEGASEGAAFGAPDAGLDPMMGGL